MMTMLILNMQVRKTMTSMMTMTRLTMNMIQITRDTVPSLTSDMGKNTVSFLAN